MQSIYEIIENRAKDALNFEWQTVSLPVPGSKEDKVFARSSAVGRSIAQPLCSTA